VNAAQLGALLTAAAGVVGAVTALVKAVQAGRKVDAHTAQHQAGAAASAEPERPPGGGTPAPS
jgi:hypothetical protein